MKALQPGAHPSTVLSWMDGSRLAASAGSLSEAVGAGVEAGGKEDADGWAHDRCSIHSATAGDDVEDLGGVAREGDDIGWIGVGDACHGDLAATGERNRGGCQAVVVGVAV